MNSFNTFSFLSVRLFQYYLGLRRRLANASTFSQDYYSDLYLTCTRDKHINMIAVLFTNGNNFVHKKKLKNVSFLGSSNWAEILFSKKVKTKLFQFFQYYRLTWNFIWDSKKLIFYNKFIWESYYITDDSVPTAQCSLSGCFS